MDQDIEIRDSISASMQARVQSSERLSRALELMAVAALSQSIGADAAPLIRQLFANDEAPAAPAAPAAPVALAAEPAPAPEAEQEPDDDDASSSSSSSSSDAPEA